MKTETTYTECELIRMPAVEIAKAIRSDIKAAVAAGKLPNIKCSVRPKRFAGGRSIDVIVVAASISVLHPERVEFEYYNPGASCGIPRYSHEAGKLLTDLKAICNRYNYDNSDAMSDHCTVNFFNQIGFDCELRAQERNRIIADLKEARAK